MKQHKKIDIYVQNKSGIYNYMVSTTRSKTCKEAKEKFLVAYPIGSDKVKTQYPRY